MTVAKEKTTKAKTVKAKTTTKAVVNEPVAPAVKHVVSTVTITPEVATPAVAPVAAAVATPVAALVTEVSVATANQVAQRAYEIWEKAAYVHGHDVEHWFAAEQELKQD